MRRLLAAAILTLLPAALFAQEPRKGNIEEDWKGGKYGLVVPASWSKAEAPKYGLWIMLIPPQHFPNQYFQLWTTPRGPEPYLTLILDIGITTDQYLAVMDKVHAEYAFDRDRVRMAAYGEAALKAIKFVSETPDVVVALVLAQGMTQTADPRPAGKNTAVLIMNDVGCTYARIDDARSFTQKLKDMGYEAALVELKNARPDEWPTSEMAKMAEWGAAQRWFAMDDLLAAAPEALKPDSNPKEWRPKLRTQLDRFARALGDAASPASLKSLADGLAKALPDSRDVLREVKLQAKPVVIVVGEAKGKKLDPNTLLICESADFEALDDAVVLCTGEVKAQKAARSVIFAKGGVAVAKAGSGLLVSAGGVVKMGGTLDDSTILAPAGVEIVGKAKANWFVNTASVKAKANDAARLMMKLRLPGGK